MKRKRSLRKRKLKPHETMDGMKSIVMDGQEKLWGHNLEWRNEKLCEAIAVCTRCNSVAVIVLRPAGMENVIVGDAVNKECPNRHEEKNDA